MMLKRTAKSCRSGAPMLASSLREEARATGGMPGETGVTVVTTLVCLFFITHEAAGASSARHSLRPLISGGATFRTKLAWIQAARSRSRVSRNAWLFEIPDM